jgi:catechol 2,3-dioxygenase-like lactoylglutathione lyase family enzyme
MMMDDELKFLEVSIPTADVRASLEWYRTLGFAELTTSDIRTYHYAVVSDGSLCIGLHGKGLEQAGLSFVRPELAKLVRQQMEDGIEFADARLSSDDFHEAVRIDPAGNPALLLEARTFSPLHEDVAQECQAGTFMHIALPCSDTEESLEFWEQFGFISVRTDTGEPAALHRPNLTVQPRIGTRELTLVYHIQDLAQTLATLEQRGISARKTPIGCELHAPEGTRFLLTTY